MALPSGAGMTKTTQTQGGARARAASTGALLTVPLIPTETAWTQGAPPIQKKKT